MLPGTHGPHDTTFDYTRAGRSAGGGALTRASHHQVPSLRRLAATVILVLTSASGLAAQDRPPLVVTRAAQAPVIDGILDDPVWQGPVPALGEWVSYNPLRGNAMPIELRTEVRLAYDSRNVYIAFHCFDDEPDKIRTTISRRDDAFDDDWVGLSLDSASTGQSAFHLLINPSGVQMDAIYSSASGEQFDADMLWYSASSLTTDGYVVELRIPLQTLRFQGGRDVGMGILFFRKISRLGVSYSWPSMPPGQWVFDRHQRMVFAELRPPRLVELLPSVTYGVSQRRETVTRWSAADSKSDIGLSGKFGITSNITLDGTINPDFSQVESDAFQVEVNQRFPIFFSEKRPFFMEGMGLFNLAGTGGDGNMRTAVHTRRVVDPAWGAKLTGTRGRTTFGVLNASDDSPIDVGNRGLGALERDKVFTIARATYALRRADYVGVLVTDTEHAGRHNRVVGADLTFKFSRPQSFSATVLRTATGGDGLASSTAHAAQVSYGYNTRRFQVLNQIEHYGRDFQMDTAFYNRTGITSGWSFGEVNFYPKGGDGFWVRRVHPFYFAQRGHDEVQDGNEDLVNAGIRFNFTRQGFFNISRIVGHSPWRGRRFENGRDISMFGDVQLFKWLRLNAGFNKGPDIFYDPVDPYAGRSRGGNVGVSLQPNQHLTQSLGVDMVQFDRADPVERIYDLHIITSKTTYQFDRHFLVRLLEQYDSSKRRLATDLLASYEFVPGSVVHAGYGALYEERAETLAAPIGEPGDHYLTVNRGFFFKGSYRHRF